MNEKIFIVDDNKDDLETLKNILEKEKYNVNIATSGKDAGNIILKGDYEIVLIDIKMPVFTGYDLVNLLREKIGSKIKLIYVTIVPKQDVKMKGINGFIQKPFEIDSVLKEVKRVRGEKLEEVNKNAKPS